MDANAAVGATEGEGSAGSLRWRLGAGPPGWRRLTLAGDIDENAELSQLFSHLGGKLEIDLAGVERINSCGVREWVHFLRQVDEGTTLRFSRCSPAIVNQLNAVSNFRGDAQIESFLAPYTCERCGADELRLLLPSVHFVPLREPLVAPVFPCEQCGDVMALDELPDRYLTFLFELAGAHG